MEEMEKENMEEKDNNAGDDPDFLKEFIKRKKLQNRVLGDILDKIKQSESIQKSQTINKNKKP